MHYGDSVKHQNPAVNQGQPMTISSLNEEGDQALCRLSDDSEEWYAAEDLTVVQDLDDSFI